MADAAADFAQKASVANAALADAEAATQQRIDAVRAETAAWASYKVARDATQTSLLELGGIATEMYDTHNGETVPGADETPPAPEPAPDDGVRRPLDQRTFEAVLRDSRRIEPSGIGRR